jgi:hypothetical protein
MQAVLTHLLLALSSPPLSLRFPRDLDFDIGRMVFFSEGPPADEDEIGSIWGPKLPVDVR